VETQNQTHIAIIGGGPGGYIAAIRAAQLGAQVTLIERERIGGVCLNVGCIPTKALLRSAEVYQLVHDAEDFGIQVGEPQVDWSKMQSRKTKIVDRLVSGVELLLDRAGVQVLHGHGRFISPNVISVEGEEVSERVEADDVIIATGSRPATIPVPGLDSPRVLDSTGALALEALPKSIAVIGGGAVGVEFASLFNALGVEVTLVEMLPRLLPRMDEMLGTTLERSLKRRRIDVLTSTSLKAVQEVEGGVEIQVEGESETSFQAEKLLLAVSRRPNVENVGLDQAGVRYTAGGIPVDKYLRTNVPHIYAIGDVIGEIMLAHWASHMGVAAVENAMGGSVAVDERSMPSCVFTMPEVSTVGLSEEEARDQGHDLLVGEFPFLANGKALAQGEREGAIKVVAESEYGEILGLHIIGPHASDLIPTGGLALPLEATLDEFKETIWPHPTLSEGLGEAALDALGIPLAIPAKNK
jgi:dihydrolipoamide dehydrogenase